MDTTEVKSILNIKHTRYDDYLITVVPLLEDHVKIYCNDDFYDDETDSTVYPGGVKISISKWAEFNLQKAGLESRTLGDASYNFELEIPKTIKQMLRPYRRLSW